MSNRLLVPVFTATIFLSAFLLFVVEPMVGKFLLPTLGGTPAVWNTAMLFFQLLLLAGYIYAHLLAKITNPRYQAILHIGLMALAAVALPLALPEGKVASSDNPIFWQLRTMIGMAAAPFFILSASAPLLQQWFAQTLHKNAHNPYFLYSASNIGSMLALLSYPVVTEPLFGLHQQSFLWAMGYGLLAALFILCAATAKFQPQPQMQEKKYVETVEWKRRFLWIFLAFCPSSLMLGYTSYITTDVASVPLFWVIPLALYLGTFIIAFSGKTIISLRVTRYLQGALLLFLVLIGSKLTINYQIFLMIFHGFLFFVTALMCHQELVATKPGTSRLTEFYLFISIGGALGGIFNSLIAPFLFKFPYEYYLVLLISAFARYASVPLANEIVGKYKWYNYLLFPGVMLVGASLIFIDAKWVNVFLAIAALLGGMILLPKRTPFLITILTIGIFSSFYTWSGLRQYVLVERNFFGTLRVSDNIAGGVRTLSNGTTTHGAQALDPLFKKIPLTYYHPFSSAGQLFGVLDDFPAPQKVAALGLGVGSIACYDHPGRSFEFYEINPAVISLTQDPKYFSYLHDCGSPYKIIQGDARQQIAQAPDHSYDLIFVDVFSSDTIPVHIMTVEAAKIYKQKLKPGGMIVIHVSNRFFDLTTEVAALADSLHTPMLYHVAFGGPVLGTKIQYAPNIYTVITDNKVALKKLMAKGWIPKAIPANIRPWSDDYANIIRALK